VTQIQQMLDTALPAGCVSFVVHSLDGATVSHPLLVHLLVDDEVINDVCCFVVDSSVGSTNCPTHTKLHYNLLCL